MPPGSTSLPRASISSRPFPRLAPSADILPPEMPISAENTSAAVATVPLRITRSKSANSGSPGKGVACIKTYTKPACLQSPRSALRLLLVGECALVTMGEQPARDAIEREIDRHARDRQEH